MYGPYINRLCTFDTSKIKVNCRRFNGREGLTAKIEIFKWRRSFPSKPVSDYGRPNEVGTDSLGHNEDLEINIEIKPQPISQTSALDYGVRMERPGRAVPAEENCTRHGKPGDAPNSTTIRNDRWFGNSRMTRYESMFLRRCEYFFLYPLMRLQTRRNLWYKVLLPPLMTCSPSQATSIYQNSSHFQNTFPIPTCRRKFRNQAICILLGVCIWISRTGARRAMNGSLH